MELEGSLPYSQNLGTVFFFVLSQVSTVHIIPSDFFKIHFNITLSSASAGIPNSLFSIGYSNKMCGKQCSLYITLPISERNYDVAVWSGFPDGWNDADM
jgi:hypothetical protein